MVYQRKSKKYRNSTLFFLCTLLFGVFVYINPVSFFSPLRSFFVTVFSPFEKIAFVTGDRLHSWREFFTSIGSVQSENTRLEQVNIELSSKLALLKDVAEENKFLRSEISLLPRDQYEFFGAEIIAHDPTGSQEWFLINKGSRDGVVQNMPIVTHGTTLLGVVRDVQLFTARVETLTAEKSVVNVFLNDSGAKGIVHGLVGQGALLDQVLQTDQLTIGSSVLTSGIGGRIPRGLLVGNVESVSQTTDGLFQQAVLSLAGDFRDTRIVFFIK